MLQKNKILRLSYRYLHENKVHRYIQVVFREVDHQDKYLKEIRRDYAESAVNKAMELCIADLKDHIRVGNANKVASFSGNDHLA